MIRHQPILGVLHLLWWIVVIGGAAEAQETGDADLDGLVIHERVELGLRQLYVTVTGRDGERVLGLAENRFRLRDDGVRQEIVTFESGDVPFTAMVLVDASQSMSNEELGVALLGLRAFVRDLRPLDEARGVLFTDSLLRVSPWAAAAPERNPQVEAGAADLVASLAIDPAAERIGGSALFDHLHLALTALERRQGRRVVILLSDGWDLHSVIDGEAIRRTGARSRSIVYWVRLDPDPPVNLHRRRRLSEASITFDFDLGSAEVPISSWHDRDATIRRYHDLERLVAESGGRVVDAPSASDVEPALASILRELREQYVLGYYPDPERPVGTWREIDLEVEGRGLDLRTRRTYVERP